MKLIILGAGTCIPMPYMASPSLAMMIKDRTVLFDMGPGTMRQLSRIGIKPDKIDQIFISHFHPDHTADLIHFLFATRNPPNLENRKPFIIAGPVGFKDFLKKLKKAYGNWLDIPSELMEIDELDIDKQEKRHYRDFDIITQPIGHTPHSLAYRIEDQHGKNFVYTGDTDPCDEVVEIAEGCDLLITECSSPESEGMGGHLTPSQAGRIATLSGIKKLVLIHFYPEVLETDIAGDCRKTYKGELILGRDLLHISI